VPDGPGLAAPARPAVVLVVMLRRLLALRLPLRFG